MADRWSDDIICSCLTPGQGRRSTKGKDIGKDIGNGNGKKRVWSIYEKSKGRVSRQIGWIYLLIILNRTCKTLSWYTNH